MPEKLVEAFVRSTDAFSLIEGDIGNIYRALAHSPKLAESWLRFAGYVARRSGLTPRERELAILRVGWLRSAEYEWAHHARIARSVGLTDAEIRATTEDLAARPWSECDRALLDATGQLVEDGDIDNATWLALESFMTPQRLLDFVFTVGNYTLISMLVRAARVQLEPGVTRFAQEDDGEGNHERAAAPYGHPDGH
ncbi:carboxymuconolactone decarboxylase family protein [Streptomyces ipomoeae]|uniref:carboxymuconolactone decarboxylase family protein n=1 Tax=Streptomyces ipomoeae TaxID=103232 RepID=UPI0015F0C51C|nr:carboxymuconolactone decarboxylase family protein [Streptomyces ipomoeae]MDX2937782.1 carboxymuconolactone decarboxylase family protein [Streptomyces ipomoeae]